MDYSKLGKRIREERKKLNLTQAQLAEAIDISDTYMGAIERGERSLTLDTLVRLVERLGVTVDYMLSDSVSDSDSNIMNQIKQVIDNQRPKPPYKIDIIKQPFYRHINQQLH